MSVSRETMQRLIVRHGAARYNAEFAKTGKSDDLRVALRGRAVAATSDVLSPDAPWMLGCRIARSRRIERPSAERKDHLAACATMRLSFPA